MVVVAEERHAEHWPLVACYQHTVTCVATVGVGVGDDVDLFVLF